ncbi:acetyltransferase [Flavobacterium branchiicola]|uniref:Acetyltransferase n=1 Tax=Flavobacterium branchiicola TaxID=1114875 RepID=A0ABV9PFZ0_9FLAO|nr:acetyltransferase [Flavobacterium branchiicola]MBS7255474.1 acetyltransferase [Flavobacterium branchiicola]
MLIVGAKGFAKEVLEVLKQLNEVENIVFYDDVTENMPEYLYDQFKILRNIQEVNIYFENIDNRFTLGIGDPKLRKILTDKFESIGGVFTSTISPKAIIGSFGNKIMHGVNLMSGVTITNDILIGKGVIINLNSTIGHDCEIEDYVEISPGVNISGNCKIGAFSVLGTNATILPRVIIGQNVIIGAGSVVTKDIPDNCLVVGTPGKIIKNLEPLKF